jgi:acyl transferase domain-containing protein
MADLARWNDDRLDDLARQVDRNAVRLEEYTTIREELAKVRERLAFVSGDTKDCITELRALKRDLEDRAVSQHDERKTDRRWMLGTVLTTAALIVTALAVFLG